MWNRFILIYLTPGVAIVALIYAYMRAAWVKKQDAGNDRMKADR